MNLIEEQLKIQTDDTCDTVDYHTKYLKKRIKIDEKELNKIFDESGPISPTEMDKLAFEKLSKLPK